MISCVVKYQVLESIDGSTSVDGAFRSEVSTKRLVTVQSVGVGVLLVDGGVRVMDVVSRRLDVLVDVVCDESVV